MSRPLLIIQPGQKLPELDGVPGDFADWVLAGMGLTAADGQVVRPQDGEALPSIEGFCGVVVTGSGAMVTDGADWMRATEAWLREVVERQVPLLGICFGHQLLAHALGGRVENNPRGIEVGTRETRLTAAAASDPLFQAVAASCRVQTSHRQSVIALPPRAVCLAASDQDPHHAFRAGPLAWGVQFHPEFSARIVTAYEAFYAPDLAPDYAAGQAQGREDNPCGGSILRRFWEICHSR